MDSGSSSWDPDDDRTLIRTSPLRTDLATDGDWCHSVVVVQGTDAGRRFAVGEQTLTVGRKPPADIRVPEAEVSAVHCQIHRLPGRDALMVADLRSTNGSFVDGQRVHERALWAPGSLLQVGTHVFRHDHQPRKAADAALEVERDLEKASRYVQSLLPTPLRSRHVSADWYFQPSARLGGDAFGYQALDDARLAGYMIDVCGHGAGSAMHSVSVLNVLRQRALPDTDFSQPAQVLRRLNDMFPMDSHGGLYFTLWYGVYDAPSRTLSYASAGHHPAYLRAPEGDDLQALQVRNPPVGMVDGIDMQQQQVTVAPGSRLYAFSDGAFEFVDKQGCQRGLADFLSLLVQPAAPPLTEPERLYRRVRELSQASALDDDFSALVVTFLSQ